MRLSWVLLGIQSKSEMVWNVSLQIVLSTGCSYDDVFVSNYVVTYTERVWNERKWS